MTHEDLEARIRDHADSLVKDAQEQLVRHVAAGKRFDDAGAFPIQAVALNAAGAATVLWIETGPLREQAIRHAIDEGAVIYALVFDGFHTATGYPRQDAITAVIRAQWGYRADFVVRYRVAGSPAGGSVAFERVDSVRARVGVHCDTDAQGRPFQWRVDPWDLWSNRAITNA